MHRTNFQYFYVLTIGFLSEDYRGARARFIGNERVAIVENHVFIEVEGQARVYAIADEDLDRSSEEKTSAVHFMRFELTEDMKKVLKAGAQMMVGCDHKGYPIHVETLAHETLASLVADLS